MTIAKGQPMLAQDIIDMDNRLQGNIDTVSSSLTSLSTSVHTALDEKENVSNKKTTISSTSDTEYPTSKAVYTGLSAKANASDVAALQTTVSGLQEKLPVGTILMYDGTGWVNNSTLPGWYKCDGTNNTPNLVNYFIRGGTSSGTTGGANSVILGKNNLPEHDHTFINGTTNSTSKDLTGHFASTENVAYLIVHDGIIGMTNETNIGGTSGWDYNNARYTIDANHSHGVTGTIGNSDTSKGEAFNILPSYYTLIYIKKIA
ncbi:MAG: hypothetical protein LBQ83_00710 [Candidatus Margulisbacteria bacterium]|nr:hypothetical protein [Candidatus Margulisiibacteriota bacterium]